MTAQFDVVHTAAAWSLLAVLQLLCVAGTAEGSACRADVTNLSRKIAPESTFMAGSTPLTSMASLLAGSFRRVSLLVVNRCPATLKVTKEGTRFILVVFGLFWLA
jgi:hypothetical protein